MGRSSPQPPVSLLDPVGQYKRLQPVIDARIATVLGHGRFVNGPEVAELETALAARSGAKHVVAVANGTDALNVALRTERIGPGDAVFVPAFSFVATGGAVALNGATPIFVDIDPRTFVMDPTVLADTIRHVRSVGDLVARAVMPVDLFGLPADYGRLEPLCREEGLFLLVDGAQSFGASQHDRRVGAFGDATITSFFPSKPLGAWGDGGAMFTDDRARMEQWRVVCAHGTSGDPYDAQRVGTNSRLDTLQAAVLLAKLPGYQDEIARRNAIANAYTEALRDVAEMLQAPVISSAGGDPRSPRWQRQCLGPVFPAGGPPGCRPGSAQRPRDPDARVLPAHPACPGGVSVLRRIGSSLSGGRKHHDSCRQSSHALGARRLNGGQGHHRASRCSPAPAGQTALAQEGIRLLTHDGRITNLELNLAGATSFATVCAHANAVLSPISGSVEEQGKVELEFRRFSRKPSWLLDESPRRLSAFRGINCNRERERGLWGRR